MTESIVLNTEMGIILSILGFTIFLFVSEIVRVDVAAIVILVILGLAGLVPADHLFDGFASNAVISIIAVMIIGSGLDKTGIMGRMAGAIARIGGHSEKRLTSIVSGTVGVISSFMQNVGAAALFIPVVSRLSTRTGVPLSRLLMPMGFCAILGGTMTMVGSSPLILLNDLIIASNHNLPSDVEAMQIYHLFSVTPIGLVLICIGILYFLVFGRFILPQRKGVGSSPDTTARFFKEVYGIEGEIYETIIPLDSPLAGTTVRQAEGRANKPFVLGIRNGNEIIIAPSQEEPIWVGSVLAIMATEHEVEQFTQQNKLHIKQELDAFMDTLIPCHTGISAAVIPPGSELIGKSAQDIQLRKKYGANLLIVHRGDNIIRNKVRWLPFQAGDTLVIHSAWTDLQVISEDTNFVVVTDYPHEIARPRKVYHALAFLGIALGLILFTDLKLSISLLAGAIGMILTGVLTIDEAYKAVSWQTVFLLASLIPLGLAVETSGTAAWIAQQTLSFMGEVSPWVMQSAIAVLATLFTLVMSNVGATVLLVPLAINIALRTGADPAIFALTVALATSNSFLIPTHQVNALIMGPAGYRVVDFMRAGGIMTVLFLVVMLIMLNLAF